MSSQLKHSLILLISMIISLASIAGVAYAQADKPNPGFAEPVAANPDSPDNITLPDSGTTSTAGTAWSITNNGSGRVAFLNSTDTTTVNPALEVRITSNNSSGTAIFGRALNSTSGVTTAGVRGLNSATNSGGYGVIGQHSGSGSGVYGLVAGAGRGVFGLSTAGSGVGVGVEGESRSFSGYGASFRNTGTAGGDGGVAVLGLSNGATTADVHPGGFTQTKAAGEFAGNIGLIGATKTGNLGGFGVIGIDNATNAGIGVEGFAKSATGIGGRFDSVQYTGILAVGGAFGAVTSSTDGTGLDSRSTNGVGVKGFSTNNDAIVGSSANPVFAGVVGANTGSGNGIYGESASGFAGYFAGDIRVIGNCSGCLKADYQIDHPLDPANKYLNYAGVASSEMLNLYSGNVTSDAQGRATVQMPAWFAPINKNYRYQLTVLGDFAQAVVSEKIKNGRFVIRTDKPNVEVSWQVTAVRADSYAAKHPVMLEQEKVGAAKGKYLDPLAYGQPDSSQLRQRPAITAPAPGK